MATKLNTKSFIKKAVDKHGLIYNYNEVHYINSTTKVNILCNMHGEFLQTPNAHLSGKKCPECSKISKKQKKTYTLHEIIKRAVLKHKGIYDYSKSTYNGIESYTIIICRQHGEFTQKWNDHINGGYGCRKCGRGKRNSLDYDSRRFNFLKTLPNTITLKSNYENSHTPTIFECKLHGEFETKPYYINENINLCSKCSNLSGSSFIEQDLFSFLKSIEVIGFENYRELEGVSEVDFLSIDKKIAIELNGCYWHSDRFKLNNYHLDKTEACESLGIQLIHIFEDEWVLKREIVESRLKAIFNKIPKKYYARNTEIKILDWKTTSQFLNDNHIQGSGSPSKVNLGLICEDILLAVMTFGGLRKSLGANPKEGSFELIRFCNKLNTSTVGGASKLLNYFNKEFKPIKLISYADRRWSLGNLYIKLGFTLELKTRPNYYYLNKSSMLREHRFKYSKHKLVESGFDKLKTEEQIMIDQGFSRIYDCGNLKFKIN